MHKRSRRSALYRNMRLLEGITGFFFACSLIVLGVFLLGNYQEFLDQTQNLLLRILRICGLLCAMSGVYYTTSLLLWMIKRRRLLPLRVVYALIATSTGIVLTVGVTFLTVMLAPV
ncbi:MAG: hypothetical protein EA384_06985 [Spirochaetaceae bacterium]|nr:MAG: hypothetical protein EA384_06985 [Spirochaetaceae bacterium]